MNKRHIHEHICTSHLPTSLPYTPTPTNLTPTHNQSYKRTYTLHTYPTYRHCPYKPTKPYIPTLSLHTYNTPTTITPCMPALSLHTSSKSRQSTGAVAFCQWCNIMCCEIYWRNYCIWIWLVCWEPPAEGRGDEFPLKSAILADCTTNIKRQEAEYWRRGWFEDRLLFQIQHNV